MITIHAAFVLVASLALLDTASANINKIDIAPEKIADVIIDQAEQHCQALNTSSGIDSTGGRRRKRDTAESRENIRQTVLQILSDCLASQELTTPPSTQTTTLHPDVANGPCTSALTVNLTGSWRKDRYGSNIRPVNGYYNCDRDLQGNTQWFRFTGDAGRQLADTCSPGYSCGSHGGFWSNATMPSRVGEIRTVRIYGSWSNNCDWYTWPTTYPLTVQRCSSRDGDFVYRAFGTSDCYWSFCGMD